MASQKDAAKIDCEQNNRRGRSELSVWGLNQPSAKLYKERIRLVSDFQGNAGICEWKG